MKAIKIENRKVETKFAHGFNFYTNKIDTFIYVIFENNASMKLHSICSEIGNEYGFSEKTSNADKMKKSTSEKKIIEFVNKYESFVTKFIS